MNILLNIEKLNNIPKLPTIFDLVNLASNSKNKLLDILEAEYNHRKQLFEFLIENDLLLDFNNYLSENI